MSTRTHPADDPEQTLPGDDDATRVAPRADAALQPGTVLRDRFVLEEVIGRGGMSVVYRALDRRRREADDRHDHIAIKVLDGSFREHPDAFVALQREARRAQTLAHPNIATVYDFDREGDTPYLCMELLTGQTLDRVLARSAPMPLEQARTIIRGMVDGLEYAHRRGIVHADMKPANVFITEDGEVKLLDFGIARVVSSPTEGTVTTFDAGRLGALTPAYASCEMFAGRAADPRDDVYALACVSYELLTGAHPFDRVHAPDARSAGLTPSAVPALSAAQNRALLDGLAFDRSARTASAGAFYAALFPETAASGTRPGKRRARRWVAAAIVLVIAAAAVWTVLGPGLGNLTGASFLATQPAVTGEPPKGAAAVVIDDPVPVPLKDDSPPDVGDVLPAPDEATRARIERILEIADLHRQMGKLVEPPGTNAAEAYAEVLRLQPDNLRAAQGLDQVGSALAREARDLEAMGDLPAAVALVDQGLTFQPEHPELLILKDRWTPTGS